jgi:hypothetical protein
VQLFLRCLHAFCCTGLRTHKGPLARDFDVSVTGSRIPLTPFDLTGQTPNITLNCALVLSDICLVNTSLAMLHQIFDLLVGMYRRCIKRKCYFRLPYFRVSCYRKSNWPCPLRRCWFVDYMENSWNLCFLQIMIAEGSIVIWTVFIPISFSLKTCGTWKCVLMKQNCVSNL